MKNDANGGVGVAVMVVGKMTMVVVAVLREY